MNIQLQYATVLAHEYVHSLEIASEDYKALRDAVFSSSVYPSEAFINCIDNIKKHKSQEMEETE